MQQLMEIKEIAFHFFLADSEHDIVVYFIQFINGLDIDAVINSSG